MRKRFIVIMLVVLWSTIALAFDPIGPPTAQLGQNQWNTGIEYIWGETDVDFDNITLGGVSLGSVTLDDFESNKIYGILGCGIADNWDVFLRLGAADADDADFAFAIGGGTKVTFSESQNGNLKWGALVQLSWVGLDYDDESGLVGATPVSLTSQEVDIVEIQIALGPEYKLNESTLLYGGALFHILDGEYDATATIAGVPFKASADLEQDSIFGGYIGANIALFDNASLNVEYQLTGGGQALALMMMWRF